MGNKTSVTDVYEIYVIPEIIFVDDFSTFMNNEKESNNEIYCYKIKKTNYKSYKNEDNELAFGRIEITSKITLEKFDLTFALLKTSESEYYCTIKPFETQELFNDSKKNVQDIFEQNSMLGTLDTMKKEFSSEYYTIKDVLIDKRKVILEKVLTKRLLKTAKTNL